MEAFMTFSQKSHLEGAMKALCRVAKSGAVFIKPVLPKIEHLVVQNESYRGDGTDSKLR